MVKNILFVLRSDAATKGGGDLVQAKFYQNVLEAEIACKVCFFHELSLSEIKEVNWDLVQVFNVSRLHENMALLQGVKYRRLLLSPILQPGFKFSLKLAVKNFIRNFLWNRSSVHHFLKEPEELFGRFDGFVFLSEAERVAFFKSFPAYAGSENVIYHNGVADGMVVGEYERVFDFIVVGRIEPKKRVVEAVDAVAEVAPKSLFVCIGGINWYHPSYGFKFFLRVLKGNVIYLGKRDPSVVYEFMRRTRVLLNFSELEVSPLVDLEALACGCNVVSTTYSYSHLPDSECFSRIDVKDMSQCYAAIIKSFDSEGCERLKINTWAENSSAYLDLVGQFLEVTENNGVVECVAP